MTVLKARSSGELNARPGTPERATVPWIVPLVPPEVTVKLPVPSVKEAVAGPAEIEAEPFVTATFRSDPVFVTAKVPLAEPVVPSVTVAAPDSDDPFVGKSRTTLPAPVLTITGAAERSPSWLYVARQPVPLIEAADVVTAMSPEATNAYLPPASASARRASIPSEPLETVADVPVPSGAVTPVAPIWTSEDVPV